MAKRDDLVKAYIGALDAGTLVILTGSGGKSGVCPGPASGQIPFETLWFAKAQHAELVLAQCPEGWADIAPAALRDEVVNAAAALGASFRTAAEVYADAKRTVEQIMENVERARIRGELRKMNADYKLYRQNELSLGRKPVGYGEHLTSFTRSLVVLAATERERQKQG
jgi:hypothetical protein